MKMNPRPFPIMDARARAPRLNKDKMDGEIRSIYRKLFTVKAIKMGLFKNLKSRRLGPPIGKEKKNKRFSWFLLSEQM
jgi:hypothetical protein